MIGSIPSNRNRGSKVFFNLQHTSHDPEFHFFMAIR